jgi:multiple antibiotic resistance protein
MGALTESFLLVFVLLNPFILSVYLMELVEALSFGQLARQLSWACVISWVVFLLFAWGGDAIFQDVLQVRFASFLIFGGITFLIMGIRLIMGIGPPVHAPSDKSLYAPASIAMPFIVGPGTISASVLAGSRLALPAAGVVIAAALAAAVVAMLAIKALHDFVRTRNEVLITRYSEIAGRVTALFTGSFAIEMILSGVERWLAARGGPG